MDDEYHYSLLDLTGDHHITIANEHLDYLVSKCLPQPLNIFLPNVIYRRTRKVFNKSAWTMKDLLKNTQKRKYRNKQRQKEHQVTQERKTERAVKACRDRVRKVKDCLDWN